MSQNFFPQSTRFVLLPGLDGSGDMFGPFSDVLGASRSDFTVVPVGAFAGTTYRELADFVLHNCVLSHGDVLIAESFSGPLALEIAADPRCPPLKALVLVATFLRRPVPWLATAVPWRLVFSVAPPRWVVRRYLLGDDASKAEIESFLAVVKCVPARDLARRVRMVLHADGRRALQNCRTRILYLQGAKDRLVPSRTATELLRSRPDVKHHVIDAPHFILQRAPLPAWHVIRDFLRAEG